jgi:Uma2 family endonuclease
MSATISTNYTAEDLLKMPDGDLYELVDGQLVERDMGTESGWIAAQLLGLLFAYLKEHREGWVFSSDASYQCFPDHPNRVRKPDVSFICKGRLPNEKIPRGHCSIAPDFVAEVVSPNDLYADVLRKVVEYLKADVTLVWVIDPGSRTVMVYRADNTVALFHEQDTLSGESVLAGFSCAVGELFPPKSAHEPASEDKNKNG